MRLLNLDPPDNMDDGAGQDQADGPPGQLGDDAGERGRAFAVDDHIPRLHGRLQATIPAFRTAERFELHY